MLDCCPEASPCAAVFLHYASHFNRLAPPSPLTIAPDKGPAGCLERQELGATRAWSDKSLERQELGLFSAQKMPSQSCWLAAMNRTSNNNPVERMLFRCGLSTSLLLLAGTAGAQVLEKLPLAAPDNQLETPAD